MLRTKPPRIDIERLQHTQAKVIHRRGSDRQVLEHEGLRWVSLNDGSIASMMLLNEPAYPLLEYIKGLLCCLLFSPRPGSLLNLGLGCGSIERFVLSQLPDIALVTVEIDPLMIELSRDFFYLPASHPVSLDSAERFLKKNQQKFDIVLCDIHLKRGTATPLRTLSFYQDAAQALTKEGVLALNLLPSTEAEMVDILLKIRRVFPWVILYDVAAVENILLYCSTSPLPNNPILTSRAKNLHQRTGIDLSHICKQLIWLPESMSKR
ncbi:MAG: methyltransferase [Candidatus Thiodiazotropha sp. (ex Epidulcina cf. delphinae)]|nr:methyltransferase [Candidatus Thiodiazotropha sp. (ex Epidulcina cf. delphinae)]